MNRRLRLLGPVAWIASLQYYATQLVVASVWPQTAGYSWTQNTISDLGNTVCGPYNQRLICSPYYGYMNASFILLGVTMILGSVLLSRRLACDKYSTLGFVSMMIAGVGTVAVGLAPENTMGWAHAAAASLPFIFGNIGMVLIGASRMSFQKWLKWLSVVFGVVGLIGVGLFATGVYLGIGSGGMERVGAYPQSLWMIVVGAVALRTRQHLDH